MPKLQVYTTEEVAQNTRRFLARFYLEPEPFEVAPEPVLLGPGLLSKAEQETLPCCVCGHQLICLKCGRGIK